MGKSNLYRKINKVLSEEETFLLSLILLAHMKENNKYKSVSELIFLFDSYKGFKQFIKYYQGTSIDVPKIDEVKQALRLLELYQKVEIDKRDFDTWYEQLNLEGLGLDKLYCRSELTKFSEYLQKDGAIVLKDMKKLSKLK